MPEKLDVGGFPLKHHTGDLLAVGSSYDTHGPSDLKFFDFSPGDFGLDLYFNFPMHYIPEEPPPDGAPPMGSDVVLLRFSPSGPHIEVYYQNRWYPLRYIVTPSYVNALLPPWFQFADVAATETQPAEHLLGIGNGALLKVLLQGLPTEDPGNGLLWLSDT